MTERQKGVAALVTVVLLWSTPTLFVKYLLPYYDPYSQNFLRYASGVVFMIPLLLRRLRQQRKKLTRAELWRLMIPTVPNVIHQTGWVVALQWVNPAFTSFLNKSSMLFAAVMAYVFFPEERWLFHSRRFLAGVVMTIAGTLGLSLLRPDLHNMQVNFAVILILMSATMWATYSVAVKKFAADIGPTVSFSVVSIYTTVLLLPPVLFVSDISRWGQAPWHVNLILIVSGVLSIGLGHTLYYYALNTLGVSVCATMLLLTPVGNMILSRWLFHEQLTNGQFLSGIILLAGGSLTLTAREKPAAQAVAKAAEAADA